MPEAGFHFEQPWWLLALLLILPISAWLRRSRVTSANARINRYADAHLMPHLTGSRELKTRERRLRLTRWAAVWSLLVIAIAGPRWDFTEIKLYSPGASLVILLDISRSMEVTDVQPNRLARARQEIEDLLDNNAGARVGLIAFASIAHVVSPITEDNASIKAQLPALATDLVRLQGSRFEEALNRARHLLAGEPKDSARHVLLISDGDFIEGTLQQQAANLAADGIRLHTLGIGTEEGGPVPAPQGKWLTDNRRNLVYSKLEANRMSRLAEAGKGLYRGADFRDDDVNAILEAVIQETGEVREQNRSTLVWNERFYWLILPAMLLLLGAFRRIRSRQPEEAPR